MDPNVGQESVLHRDPKGPPRRRANPHLGPGFRGNDRPPVGGAIGRDSGQVRRTVVVRCDGLTLPEVVRRASWPVATVPTDAIQGYHRLLEMVRRPTTACPAAGEWAREEDGDGVREVHTKAQEGLWTGLRTFLRPSRGVNQVDLSQDVALFEWGHNVKRATGEFRRVRMGVKHPTSCPT